MAEVRRVKTASEEGHARTAEGLQVHAFMVACAGAAGTGSGVCGFPPISQRTRNGWGTVRLWVNRICKKLQSAVDGWNYPTPVHPNDEDLSLGTPKPQKQVRGEGGAPGMLFFPRSENPDLIA
jgi:hypothetical protein